MAHSYSNHQRMATKPPSSLALHNCEASGVAGTDYGYASGNSQNNDHSWQTEQTINLENINLDEFDNDHFNLLNFINDGSSPLEESAPRLEDDDIQKQKDEAIYAQYQYDQMFSNMRHQQRHDFGPNDFGVASSVPSSCYTSGGTLELVDPGNAFHFREEEEPETPRISAAPSRDGGVTLVPSTSHSSVQQLLRVPIVKEEVFKEEPPENDDPNIGQMCGSSSSRASSVASSGIFTTVLSSSQQPVKPRKYRIKSDKEKSNPVYRLKRIKNNDAVRRSRDKSKQQQMAKEHRLIFLEQETREQANLIEELKVQNADLQNECQRLRQNCRCGLATHKSAQQQRH